MIQPSADPLFDSFLILNLYFEPNTNSGNNSWDLKSEQNRRSKSASERSEPQKFDSLEERPPGDDLCMEVDQNPPIRRFKVSCSDHSVSSSYGDHFTWRIWIWKVVFLLLLQSICYSWFVLINSINDLKINYNYNNSNNDNNNKLIKITLRGWWALIKLMHNISDSIRLPFLSFTLFFKVTSSWYYIIKYIARRTYYWQSSKL